MIAAVLIGIMTVFSVAAQKPNSKFKGVQVGCISYSFRSMPSDLESVLQQCKDAGVSSVELMGYSAEQYAGIPNENQAQWRKTVSMDKFKEIKKMFDKAGIKIHILKLGEPNWSDEEIDYAFRAAKAVGAKGITFEIGEDAAKRMAPFAEKHKMYAIMHNHGQPGDPSFNFDKMLAPGKYLMLNFDIGHYWGATGINPVTIVEKYHDRIYSIHVKDKTGKFDNPKDRNQTFGKGTTPVADVLKAIQKNKWNIYADIELEYDIPAGSDAVKEVGKCVIYCKNILEK